MGYQRKTRDVYKIVWKGETVDTFDKATTTKSEAMKMLVEYNLAFRGGCSLNLGREAI